MSDHAAIRAKDQSNAEAYLRKCGYKDGGKVSPVEAVHKHERHDHAGEPLTKFRAGGTVKGDAPKTRLDKYARGGSVKHKGPSKINIVIATGQNGDAEKRAAFQQGAQMGAMMSRPAAPPMPPPRPPMPQQGMPQGMPPGMIPPNMTGARPPMKRGGAVKVNDEGGAGGGEGRLEKSGMVAVKAHTRRKAGGRV